MAGPAAEAKKKRKAPSSSREDEDEGGGDGQSSATGQATPLVVCGDDSKEEEEEEEEEAAAAATAAPPTKKKKKARWRDQKACTVVLRQVAYDASAESIRAHFAAVGCEPRDVRLVADPASSAAATKGRGGPAPSDSEVRRLHAGLVYVVFDGDAKAKDAVLKARGTTLGGRRVDAALLGEAPQADESGRFVRPAQGAGDGADFADTELAKYGVALDDLDAALRARLKRSPRAVVERVLRDVAIKVQDKQREEEASTSDKKRRCVFLENVSAFASGVLKRCLEEEEAHADRAILPPVIVDRLVDEAIAASCGALSKADFDARCRAYAREFRHVDLEEALRDVTSIAMAEAGKKKKHRRLQSVSAFFMGILRDLKKATGTDEPARDHHPPRGMGKGKGKGRGGKGKGKGRGVKGRGHGGSKPEVAAPARR